MENEKRLIDYHEVRLLFDEEYKKTAQLIRDGETHLDNLAEGFTEADRVIWKLPKVDAVEVVRCKDCKYAKNMAPIGESKYMIGECFLRDEDEIEFMVYDDDFCSYGERREAERREGE